MGATQTLHFHGTSEGVFYKRENEQPLHHIEAVKGDKREPYLLIGITQRENIFL